MRFWGSLVVGLAVALPALAQPMPADPAAALCAPFTNAALEADQLRGDWPYTRITAEGDTYHGCLRLGPGAGGVNRVAYFLGGDRVVVEFDVTVSVQDQVVVFLGQAPVRYLQGRGSYAVDHFTCAPAEAGLACTHEDANGTVDPPFRLRRG